MQNLSMDFLHYNTTLFFVILLFSIYLFQRYYNKKPSKNLPPCPPSLPFIGHLHLLRPPRHLSIHSLSKLYGPVLGLRLGSCNAIILSSPAAIKEALIKNDPVFSNRPMIKAGDVLGYKNTSIFFSPHGPHWRNLRRLTSSELLSTRRLNLLAGIRFNEFLSLIHRMVKASSSGEVELKARLFEMGHNSMSKIVFGKRYYGENLDGEVDVANQFKDIMHEAIDLVFSFNPRDFFPALGWLDLLGVERRMKRLLPRLDGFITEIIEEQRRRRSEAVNAGREAEETNLLDVMLSMQETDPEMYTDEHIKGHILSILTAGNDTTAGTIETAMLLLLSHPEIMKKAKTEIDMSVGHNHILDESDLLKLPYLKNILKETLRLSPPMQGMPPRASSADCTIQGYHVPKGTILFVNVWGLQRDPDLWDDAMSFKPERFAGEEEEEEEEDVKYVPFGAGRRKCPGEHFGMRMVMAGVGALVQCFDWEPMSKEEVDINALLGLTVPKGQPMVAKYKVRACMVDALSKI
ncbi:Isoflavone 2'-hydroxylase protein [Dioscorea alata]|uniref:Isoflavone 2'-hydroxylase protein n=1 Tax=Dioscorea alata TaxID=55571 RepID=A0ACB7TWN6_DIOAL|nr:Isoflavone 2'-hydroxylase protein [Dioscorea alata]